MASNAKQEFILVSPYFVPGDDGVSGLQWLVERGVKVRVLTNSLASTDATAAYMGFRPYRKSLVEAGIEMYEMKPIPGSHPHSHHFSSSSRASLHSKIYVVDRTDVMIGSFNLDPRSIDLNTEMALVIHSPALAQQVVGIFEKAITPASSYQLMMKNHDVIWTGEEEGIKEEYTSEPKAGFWRRVKTDLLGLLPLEDQL